MTRTSTTCFCIFVLAAAACGDFVGGPDYDTTDAIVATSSTMENDPRNSPTRTIDGSGLDPGGQKHSTQMFTVEPGVQWMAETRDHGHKSGASDTGLGWIKYEFDNIYPLAELRIWNYNTGITARGMKDVTIQYSCDGVTWATLGDYTIPLAPGSDDYTGSVVADFGGILARSVVITARPSGPNWGGENVGNIALSEVRFHHTPEPGMISLIVLGCVTAAANRKRRRARGPRVDAVGAA